MKRGIYQGWTGRRNLGDEAMFQSCCRNLSHIHWIPFSLADSLPAPGSVASLWDSYRRSLLSFLSGQVAIFGGGTLVNRSPLWLEQYKLLRQANRKPVPLLSPGVANPCYWTGRNGWRDMRSEWRDLLMELPEIGVRGPISKRLLDEAGLRNVLVTGDPALGFYRDISAQPPGRRAVAVNVGRSKGEMWGNEDRALSEIAAGVRSLAALGFDVHIFPVWDRDEPSCREVARSAGLSEDALDPLILDPDEFLRYVTRFDVVISLKLHAAVLAAAAGVPFVAVEYRPKVRDFTESVGFGRFTFRSDCFEGKDLVRASLEIYDDLSGARARLDSRVRELSEIFTAYSRRLEEFVLD
jgi:polysaccharide pyruvyl transferase WcaK-like protein